MTAMAGRNTIVGASFLLLVAGCGSISDNIGLDTPPISGASATDAHDAREDDPIRMSDPTDEQQAVAAFDPEVLGACIERPDDPLGYFRGDLPLPASLFEDVDGWHHLPPDVEVRVVTRGHPDGPPTDDPAEVSARDKVDVALTGAVRLRGDDHPSMIVPVPNVALMRDAQAAGADLYLGGTHHPGAVDHESDYRSRFLVAVHGDAVAVIGDCQYRYMTGGVDRFAESRAETSATTFLGLVTGDIPAAAFVAWQEGPAPVDPRDIEVWNGLEPHERSLDPEMTPPEIYETVSGIPMFLDYEAREITPGTLLCPRSERARSECYDLASMGRFVYPFAAFADVPLQLWLVDEQPSDGAQSDIGPVTTLPAQLLQEVVAAEASDEPLVIWVTGLDRDGDVEVDTIARAEAEDRAFGDDGS